MYPDRESVERLEDGFGQDEALLASRGHVDPSHGRVDSEHLVADDEEPPRLQDAEAQN